MKKMPDSLPVGLEGRVTTHWLLDPPPFFYPAFPETHTRAGLALRMFLNGEELGWRLPGDFFPGSAIAKAVVTQLRMLGWPINEFELSSPTEEDPSRTVVRYTLPEEYIVEALARVAGLPRCFPPPSNYTPSHAQSASPEKEGTRP